MGFYIIEGVEQLNEIADYRRLDARVGWNPSENFRFYVGVQDAFNPYRSEYDSYDLSRRSAYLGLTLGK
jgi:outer membrane receptor protein involved in Fe transport